MNVSNWDLLIDAIMATIIQTAFTSMIGIMSVIPGGAVGILYLLYRDGGKFPKIGLKLRGVKNEV